MPGSTGGRSGGIALDFRRGKTAGKLLEIAWTYPVHKPAAAEGRAGETTAAVVGSALPIEQAYDVVTAGDRRPLLVLRECDRCKGTDHALLSRKLDNEQTVLLTHWFRCVKLPPNVLSPNHPLANLFLHENDGTSIPHLFFADPDGSNRMELPGDQSQTVLWNTMFGYLDRCYTDDAKAAIKGLRQVLGQYDKLDAEEQQLKTRIDREIEKNGMGSPKLKKLDRDLQALGETRAGLAAKEKDLRDLALKAMVTPAVPTAGQGAMK